MAKFAVLYNRIKILASESFLKVEDEHQKAANGAKKINPFHNSCGSEVGSFKGCG